MKKTMYLAMLIAAMMFSMPMNAQQGQEILLDDVPCNGPEFFSTPEMIRATGIGESMQQQMAKRLAYSSAVKELAGKINTTIDAVFTMYVNDETTNMDETFYQKYEGMQQEMVSQSTGYRTICEKYAFYTNNAGRKIYKCYLAIEIGTDEILKPIYDAIQKEDASNQFDVEYNEFKKEFNQIFEQNGNL